MLIDNPIIKDYVNLNLHCQGEINNHATRHANGIVIFYDKLNMFLNHLAGMDKVNVPILSVLSYMPCLYQEQKGQVPLSAEPY